MKKRTWLIGLLVEKHGWPHARPTAPLSEGLAFFDYSTPEAHKVAAEMNAGLPSREWRVHLKVCSRGVIFEREL